MPRLYLDHAASTPVCEEALKAMRPWLGKRWGNPSSLHEDGREARRAIDRAREQVAEAFGCLFGEIIFTSSGTESCTMALAGAALSRPEGRSRILLGASEHHCVLHAQGLLEGLGCRVELIRVDREARVDLDHLESLAGEDVLLVSVMHANNETGVINDLLAISSLARRWGALLHVDAVQTFPWVRSEELGADMASFSSHKFYGPQGGGALFLRSGVKIKPIIPGGGQEREMRGGTEATAAIAGMGEAASACLAHPEWREAQRAARDAFVAELSALEPEGQVWTLPRHDGLPGHAHLRLAGIQADTMLIRLDRAGVSASSGAACSSGSLEPSHVLLAAGLSEEEAGEGLRFTFGKDNSPEEARRAAWVLSEAAQEVRRAQRAALG